MCRGLGPTGTQQCAIGIRPRQAHAIEGELIQVKAESSQDTLNYPVKLNTKLANLAGSVGAGDAAPTRQAQELYAELAGRVDEELARLRTVTSEDVAAFNDLVRKAKLPAVSFDGGEAETK